tara:strand:- start:9403 stop:10173 length:771 start_codon:yes stop_codon:yes gene_type:complete
MTPEVVLDALQLPAQALIAHRVPKTLLVENGAPTAADKRHIETGIEELRWVATLKPTTVGVATYTDDTREAVELAVLILRVRTKAKLTRLVELVHRAVPYHLLLLTQMTLEDKRVGVHLSLADKRWAQNEKDKVVLDGDIVQCDTATLTEAVHQRLIESLSITHQPRSNLHTLYRGWIDTILTAKAATITGDFVPAADADHAQDRATALKACAKLEGRIASIRSAAAKEKQLARRVELNTQLKALKGELDTARQRL